MKPVLLLSLVLLFSACKIETQKASSTGTETSASYVLDDNQIALRSDVNSSEEIARFKEEITERQERNPETVFEVVPMQEKTGNVILSGLKDNHLYKSKNFYIFIGLGSKEKDQTIQKTDWDAIYYIMNYVSRLKYRVMINVQATGEHLKLASEDEETSVILWSSHGNKKGFYDYNGDKVPYDVFKNKSKGFYQFVLSSCEGAIALHDNYITSGLRIWAWEGLTNSTELKNFLVSDAWSIQDGANLSAVKSNLTCTASGSKFKLMQASSRNLAYGYPFDDLASCEKRLTSSKNGAVCSKGDQGIKKVNGQTLEVSERTYATMEECTLE